MLRVISCRSPVSPRINQRFIWEIGYRVCYNSCTGLHVTTWDIDIKGLDSAIKETKKWCNLFDHSYNHLELSQHSVGINLLHSCDEHLHNAVCSYHDWLTLIGVVAEDKFIAPDVSMTMGIFLSRANLKTFSSLWVIPSGLIYINKPHNHRSQMSW